MAIEFFIKIMDEGELSTEDLLKFSELQLEMEIRSEPFEHRYRARYGSYQRRSNATTIRIRIDTDKTCMIESISLVLPKTEAGSLLKFTEVGLCIGGMNLMSYTSEMLAINHAINDVHWIYHIDTVEIPVFQFKPMGLPLSRFIFHDMTLKILFYQDDASTVEAEMEAEEVEKVEAVVRGRNHKYKTLQDDLNYSILANKINGNDDSHNLCFNILHQYPEHVVFGMSYNKTINYVHMSDYPLLIIKFVPKGDVEIPRIIDVKIQVQLPRSSVKSSNLDTTLLQIDDFYVVCLLPDMVNCKEDLVKLQYHKIPRSTSSRKLFIDITFDSLEFIDNLPDINIISAAWRTWDFNGAFINSVR